MVMINVLRVVSPQPDVHGMQVHAATDMGNQCGRKFSAAPDDRGPSERHRHIESRQQSHAAASGHSRGDGQTKKRKGRLVNPEGLKLNGNR